MKSIRTIIALAAALTAAGAMAQGPTSTDEARAQAAQALAATAMDRAFELPALDPVAVGDYRAAGHNAVLLNQFVEFHHDLKAYMDGERSTPIAVNGEDSARDEAGRRRAEGDMAQYAAHLQSSPTAWLIHQEVMGDTGTLALR
jgi:hypothetical protein